MTTGPARPVAIRAGVIENLRVSTTMRRLTLAVPEGWGPPLPGQFVSLAPGCDWDDGFSGAPEGGLLRRPFSVADFRVEGRSHRLDLLYSPVGGGTRRLAEIPAGAAIDLLGPLGTAFPLETEGTPLLVAGGRGIAPFVFYARERLRRGASATLLYGARTGAELIALPDLPAERLLLAAEDGSRGARGTVCTLLDEHGPGQPGPVLSCGPHGMLQAIVAWARAHRRRCWVSVESIFGCGIGLCGGCAVPGREGGFRWACRDGPVMDAEELDWERWKRESTCG